MCFSAGASFTASAFLTFAGTETIRKVHKPSQIVFASITFFFAFQQFFEGVLWLIIGQRGYRGLQTVVTYIFLVMAQVVWPIMIPLSVLLMEKIKKRKIVLTVLLVVGVAVGLHYLIRLIFFDILAEISRKHLTYESSIRDPFEAIALFTYLVATIVPLVISSVKRSNFLGAILALSFVVSLVFYTYCLVSVWCFFAAIISFVIYYIIGDAHAKFYFGKILAAHA